MFLITYNKIINIIEPFNKERKKEVFNYGTSIWVSRYFTHASFMIRK